ncbi:uncharacterized protein LY89DRAFT_739523 [Mollisia scopiformis]|uniref:RBR-type E3 ubiquitin transferase n=1 Tax=Mollisia scopiformis TaxID=149040 RepID=A0A194WTP9_MOLSC|nr:uncharacterized protein LY89DRAFT_739523 [Mollisia scopiformis]KUJ11326.1 hypothetical protein LY89DRAFT_739523 [Mollisia scopiformis]
MAAAMVISMPGGWPRPSEESDRGIDHLQVPRIDTQIRRPSIHVPTSVSASSSRNNDELFFDTPLSASITEVNDTPYLMFEPVVESVERNDQLEWWRYDPPQELFRVQEGTSEELAGLIPRSIERLRTQQEEAERQAAAAREVRPLIRTTRTVPRPRRNAVPTISNLDPSSATDEESDPSNNSATSLVSNDSGYASTTPEASKAPVQAITNESISMTSGKGKHRGPFSLSSLFRRKDNSTFNFDIPHIDTSQTSSSRDRVSPHYSSVEVQAPISPVPQVSVSESSTTECVSCLDDFASGDMVKLTCHSYCTDCFQRLITTALETEAQWPAKCCLNPIPSETIIPHLDTATKEKYTQRSAEWSIPTSDRIYCSHAGCNAWIPPRRIHKSTNTARCKSCSHKTCTQCRGEPHHGVDCPQDPALQQTISLAEMEGWKRCYQCNAFVEHNQGCRHMTCRCKAEFCYICTARWRTCACTDAQLAIAQQDANVRRQERAAEIARLEAAAEEERILVQMVEDFERQEAERAAAAAEEQRLRDEEARARREEEDRRIEERRVAAIGQRFRELNSELEGLNEVQRVLIAERYEFEIEVLRKERQDALDALSVRHVPEKEALALSSEKMVFDAEYSYKQEYRTRLAEERRIEEEYIAQLQAFWQGKENAEQVVREKREELRSEQDREYKFWDAYRRKQIFAAKEGEKRKMERLMVKHGNEIKVVEGRAESDGVEWRRKVKAEGMWVEAVVRERTGMLQEMEVVEYGRV